MGPRLFPVLAFVSLLANTVLLTVLVLERGAPPVFGQTADGGGGRFALGTEKGSDQSPICFVIANGEKPQLLVYRVDPAGQLQLTNAREITCDLGLRDNYFPAGSTAKAGKTAPPVSAVCTAVSRTGSGAAGGGAGGNGKAPAPGKDKDKDKEKEKSKEKAEQGDAEKDSAAEGDGK